MARPIGHVAVVGLGLIGSSIARAIDDRLPQVTVTGHDASADVRTIAQEHILALEAKAASLQAIAGSLR